MIRLMASFFSLLLITGCFLVVREESSIGGPVPGELIFAIDSRENILMKSSTIGLLTVGWSKGSASCRLSRKAKQSWSVVREASSTWKTSLREEIAIDPNLINYGVAVAFIRKQENGLFDIRQVDSGDQALRAANALRTILDECDLKVDFKAHIIQRE